MASHAHTILPNNPVVVLEFIENDVRVTRACRQRRQCRWQLLIGLIFFTEIHEHNQFLHYECHTTYQQWHCYDQIGDRLHLMTPRCRHRNRLVWQSLTECLQRILILTNGDATATQFEKEPTKDVPETFVIQLVAINHKEVIIVHLACILLQ